MVYTTKSIVENNDILGSAPSTAVLPNCGTFLETAMYVAAACEEAYTDLMSSIGISELAVYESTGAEVVYEAEDGSETDAKKELDGNTDNFFKKVWNAIKGMFEKAIAWISEKVRTWQKDLREKKIAKFDKIWSEKSKDIPDDMKFGKASFITANNAFEAPEKVLTRAGADAGSITKIAEGIIGGKFDTDITLDYKGQTYDNIADFKKAVYADPDIKTKEPVEITKKFVSENIVNICAIVVNGKSLPEVKAEYNKAKNAINTMANGVKKNKKNTENYKNIMNGLRKCVTILTAYCGIELDIVKQNYIEASRLLANVAMKLRFKVKPEAEDKDGKAKEAAPANESALIDSVAEAFNW